MYYSKEDASGWMRVASNLQKKIEQLQKEKKKKDDMNTLTISPAIAAGYILADKRHLHRINEKLAESGYQIRKG
jgi:hypothetical protein